MQTLESARDIWFYEEYTFRAKSSALIGSEQNGNYDEGKRVQAT